MRSMLCALGGAALLGFLLCVTNIACAEAPAVPDAQFAQGQSALNIPFESWNNLIFVRCQVNGAEPAWFVLDTGASYNVLDTEWARRWKLNLGQKQTSPRTGMEYVQVNGLTFGLPGVEVANQPARVMSLEGLWAFAGQTMAGILGYDFIRPFVLQVDYAAKTVSLHDPQTYRYTGSGERLPLTIADKWPVVPVRLTQSGHPPFEGRILLDTGSLMPVSLLDSTLAKKTIENPAAVGIGGVGGGGLLGRLQSLHLGRLVIKDPVSGFPPLGARPSDPLSEAIGQVSAGVLGGEILHRFTLIFDYQHQLLILEPNRYFKDPVEWDMSGLFLIARGEAFQEFTVFRVMKDSPAAQAGLREGDVLVAIDGRLAEELNLADVRELLKQKGKRCRLTIQRGDETLEVSLKLKRMV
jgi:hypothetical protein